ncbi:MAG: hypothetical protein ABIK97_03270 [candidate division WOR-3 bacterium]
MKSQIFYTDTYKKIEIKIKEFLNKQPDFLTKATVTSTRATGDAIQTILGENFQSIVGSVVKEYSTDFARRAMADFAFTDQDNFYYLVDVKTHRLETKFNMPNLTSVVRLARFYKDDRNYYVILLIAYQVISGIHIKVEKVHFVPIEFLSWDCLTVGALGWGQIQIANANNIKTNPKYSRKKWMLEMCEVLFRFYPREIEKVKNRLEYFKKIEKYWRERTDI